MCLIQQDPGVKIEQPLVAFKVVRVMTSNWFASQYEPHQRSVWNTAFDLGDHLDYRSDQETWALAGPGICLFEALADALSELSTYDHHKRMAVVEVEVPAGAVVRRGSQATMRGYAPILAASRVRTTRLHRVSAY